VAGGGGRSPDDGIGALRRALTALVAVARAAATAESSGGSSAQLPHMQAAYMRILDEAWARGVALYDTALVSVAPAGQHMVPLTAAAAASVAGSVEASMCTYLRRGGGVPPEHSVAAARAAALHDLLLAAVLAPAAARARLLYDVATWHRVLRLLSMSDMDAVLTGYHAGLLLQGITPTVSTYATLLQAAVRHRDAPTAYTVINAASLAGMKLSTAFGEALLAQALAVPTHGRGWEGCDGGETARDVVRYLFGLQAADLVHLTDRLRVQQARGGPTAAPLRSAPLDLVGWAIAQGRSALPPGTAWLAAPHVPGTRTLRMKSSATVGLSMLSPLPPPSPVSPTALPSLRRVVEEPAAADSPPAGDALPRRRLRRRAGAPPVASLAGSRRSRDDDAAAAAVAALDLEGGDEEAADTSDDSDGEGDDDLDGGSSEVIAAAGRRPDGSLVVVTRPDYLFPAATSTADGALVPADSNFPSHAGGSDDADGSDDDNLDAADGDDGDGDEDDDDEEADGDDTGATIDDFSRRRADEVDLNIQRVSAALSMVLSRAAREAAARRAAGHGRTSRSGGGGGRRALYGGNGLPWGVPRRVPRPLQWQQLASPSGDGTTRSRLRLRRRITAPRVPPLPLPLPPSTGSLEAQAAGSALAAAQPQPQPQPRTSVPLWVLRALAADDARRVRTQKLLDLDASVVGDDAGVEEAVTRRLHHLARYGLMPSIGVVIPPSHAASMAWWTAAGERAMQMATSGGAGGADPAAATPAEAALSLPPSPYLMVRWKPAPPTPAATAAPPSAVLQRLTTSSFATFMLPHLRDLAGATRPLPRQPHPLR